MAFDPEPPNTPERPPEVPAANGNPARPEGESAPCARSHKELQDELEKLYRMLAVALGELDDYRRLVGPAVLIPLLEKDLVRFIEEECKDAQPLEQFLPELEAILNGNEDA
jgi:hypothetical protein